MRLILICAALTCAPLTPLLAQTFTCTIQPSGGFSGVTPRQMVLNFNKGTRQVAIRDDVASKVGFDGHAGTIRRVVGDEFLFNWKVKGVPNKLKPSNDRASLGRKVLYSGRLNQSTGAIRVTGNFVTIRSGTSSGQNMRGKGQCRPD